jgi:uncharacterized OB-fold protein
MPITENTGKECPTCGAINNSAKNYCRSCGYEFTSVKLSKEFIDSIASEVSSIKKQREELE